jgi:formylglycine-generating enzyme required for sulfatase activity
MSDIPRETLIQIVSRFGPQVCEDPRRCEALLRDLCGSHKKEINALIAAIRSDFIEELRACKQTALQKVVIERSIKQLHDDTGIVIELARWSIDSWSLALGLLTQSEAKYQFRCPSCGTAGNNKYPISGKRVICPNCRARVRVSSDGQNFSLESKNSTSNNTRVEKPSRVKSHSSTGQLRPTTLDRNEQLRSRFREIIANGVILEEDREEISNLRLKLGITIQQSRAIFDQVKTVASITDSLLSSTIKNSLGMTMKLILPTKFLMGAGQELHQVTLTKPFYLGIYQVTQEQYQHVMGYNPSHFVGVRNPVDSVTWEKAAEFCRLLSETPSEKAAGHFYRLPTEAEWECACRAGTKTAYSFGESVSELSNHGWFNVNAGFTTHAVGAKQPNPFGLFDMHGNVWEWCSNFFGQYTRGSLTDPTGPTQGLKRVIRGGCWSSTATNCQSSSRCGVIRSYRSNYLGFRLLMSL